MFFHLVRPFLATYVSRIQLSRRTCIQREVIKMESGQHLHVYSTSLIPSALSSLPSCDGDSRATTRTKKYTGEDLPSSTPSLRSCICDSKNHSIVFCVSSANCRCLIRRISPNFDHWSIHSTSRYTSICFQLWLKSMTCAARNNATNQEAQFFSSITSRSHHVLKFYMATINSDINV